MKMCKQYSKMLWHFLYNYILKMDHIAIKVASGEWVQEGTRFCPFAVIPEQWLIEERKHSPIFYSHVNSQHNCLVLHHAMFGKPLLAEASLGCCEHPLTEQPQPCVGPWLGPSSLLLFRLL